jgi:hypothetical protein
MSLFKVEIAASLALLFAVACGDSGDSMGDDDDDVVADADAGPRSDSGLPVPALEWTWIDVPGTECMNDTATGMGVNLNPDSDKLMIYLEGGGACFNSFTCTGVAHQNGFGQVDFDAVIRDNGTAGVFNREDADNPFKDWNMVFIPYCTGDIFAGATPDGFGGRNQVGYTNMGHYTNMLVDAFPGANHVVLTGSSAGGFGAAYNFDRVQTAFGDTRVTLLDDSGPALGPDYMTPCMGEMVRDVWNLDATLPQDCSECFQEGGLSRLTHYIAQKYTDRQFGLITSTRDGVIRLFLGWGYPNCANPTVPMPESAFSEGITQLRDELLAPYDNFRVYTIDSGLHVWLLENPVGSTNVQGVSLTAWIRQMLDDESAWNDVVP